MKPKEIKSGLLMLCSFISLLFIFFRPGIHPAVAHKEKPRTVAGCDAIHWATWTNFSRSNASGTIDEGNGNSVGISMSSNFDFSSTSTIYNYWLFGYYSSPPPNEPVPKTTWAVGNGGSTRMTFSHTETNPVLLISSLGQTGQRVTLGFSLPYVVLYDAGGMTFDNSTSITGEEGYAIIMFPGDFKSVVISSTTPEEYTNITWGLSEVPFPVSVTQTASSCGSTTVTASGGLSYSWNGGDNRASATNTFHSSGLYIVTVKNADGCAASVSQRIDIHSAPVIAVNGSLTGCGSVSVTAFVDSALSYQWDGGDTPGSAANTFSSSGRYTVKVTDAYQCQASRSVDVIVNQPVTPAINISASPSGQVYSGVPVTYSASFSNGGDLPGLRWLKNGVPVGSGKTYTTTNLANGDTIECALTSHAPCAVPDTLTSNGIIANVITRVATDIVIPNTFTPNGDGINDTWGIPNLTTYPNATVDIYNRYGENLYHSVGYARPWGGVYNGKKLPVGTYYYIIDLKDEAHSIKSGWVAILR